MLDSNNFLCRWKSRVFRKDIASVITEIHIINPIDRISLVSECLFS